nr:hypothetical protein [Tanacetum cinerariifolium]
MVPNSKKLIEVFIGGLPRSIKGNVTASKRQTLEEVITITQRLIDKIIKHNSTQDTNDHKRKFDDKNITDNNNYPNDHNNNYQNNHNNHNHNNDHHQQQNKKQKTFKTYVATNGYTGNRPLCERCTLYHIRPCSVKCQNFNKHAQPEDLNELFQKLLEDLKELTEYVNSPRRDRPIFFDNNEDHFVQNKEYLEKSSNEIAASNSNQEKEKPPQDSDIRQLIREECCIEVCEEQKHNMENTILELVKICQEKELYCMHDNDDDLIENQSSLVFTTFSNPLFNNNDDLDSSDVESLPDEDVLIEEFKIYSNPLFDDDKINSGKLDPHCFNVESDFVESLLNHDTFIDSSPKSNFLLKEFSGELAHTNPKIKEADFDFEEEIRLIENLLYDNSFPRMPKELNAEIIDTIIESLPSLPIPVQDGNSQREEIDIVTEADDVLPPKNIHFLEELLSDNSIPLTEDESSDSDHQDDPSLPRPPPKPPNDLPLID